MDRSIVNPFAPKEARQTKFIAKSKLSQKIPKIGLFQILNISDCFGPKYPAVLDFEQQRFC